jgi:hypothetical protein
MIGIQPIAFRHRQQRRFDQGAIKGRQRERFKFQKRFRRAGDFRLLHQQQILQPNAKFACSVVARFIGQNHALSQRHHARCTAEGRRPFMH